MKKVYIFVSLFLLSAFLQIASSTAQTLGYNGFNVSLGAVMPEDWDTGFNIGVGVCIGEIVENLFIYPGLTYWEASSEDMGSAYEDAGLSNVAVSCDAQYHFTGVQSGPYAGAGFSLNMLSWDYAYAAYVPHRVTYWADDSDQRIGFHPIIGYIKDLVHFPVLWK